MPRPTLPKNAKAGKGKQLLVDLIGEGEALPDLPELVVEERVLGKGQVLDLYHGDEQGDVLGGGGGEEWMKAKEIGALVPEKRVEGVDGEKEEGVRGEDTPITGRATHIALHPTKENLIAPPADPVVALSRLDSKQDSSVNNNAASNEPRALPPAEVLSATDLNKTHTESAEAPNVIATATEEAAADGDDEDDGEEEVEIELEMEDNPSRKWVVDGDGDSD
jgi:hypothetical protein